MRAPGSRASVRHKSGLHDAALQRRRSRPDEAFPRGHGTRMGEPTDRAAHSTRRGFGLRTAQPPRSKSHRELFVVTAHRGPIRAVASCSNRMSTRRPTAETAAPSARELRAECSSAEPDREGEVSIAPIVHAARGASRFRSQVRAGATHFCDSSGNPRASPGALRLQVRMGAEESSAPYGIYLAGYVVPPSPDRAAAMTLGCIARSRERRCAIEPEVSRVTEEPRRCPWDHASRLA